MCTAWPAPPVPPWARRQHPQDKPGLAEIPRRRHGAKSLFVVHHGICSSRTWLSKANHRFSINVFVNVLVGTICRYRCI